MVQDVLLMAGARGSRTHHPDRWAGITGVEVREGHQAPSAPVKAKEPITLEVMAL